MMTPKQINIAISEKCGFTTIHPPEAEKWRPLRGVDKDGKLTIVPNYHGSLDAMNDAEKVLTRRQQSQYTTYLKQLVQDTTVDTTYDIVRATAPQRAEAFLRTLNLWKD